MKVASIVGARPQFVKAAALSPVLRQYATEVLVHTGQHYDYAMSQLFFEQLALPAPEFHLGVGSGPQGRQTGEMLQRIEAVLLPLRPDWVIVYGDTNSTLAGALAAAKLGLAVAHVEAGMRSGVRAMPEEINRVVTDHLATLFFCATQTAVANLEREGITRGVHHVGDLMADLLATLLPRAAGVGATERFGVHAGRYVLATIHRAANTASADVLARIFDGLATSSDPVLLPLHPRTRAALERFHVRVTPPIHITEPVGYLEMLQLESEARLIVTDSGGVQKEAYLLGVPCLTLRDETEWPETLFGGWNTLVGGAADAIAAGLRAARPVAARPAVFGNGDVARRIADLLTS